MSNEQSSPDRHASRKLKPLRRRTWPYLVVLGLLAGGIVMAQAALAIPGRGFHGHRGHGDLSDEQVLDRVSWTTDFVLDAIDATDEQRAEVEAIIDQSTRDLLSLRAEGQALHDEIHGALMADEPDPEELERLRVSVVDIVDRASREVVETFTEVNAVLTPEQRAQLRERWEH